ncbi:MAG: PilZ domain-containing protein [Bacteriovoracaceae bacterium]|nr:PilZ domain-containing protein [Bacteriovoracaceae bacterium]
MGADRRGRVRSVCEHEIALRFDGSDFTDYTTRNISLSGMYVNTKNPPVCTLQSNVEIILSSIHDDIKHKVKGHIVRIESEGVAIQFDSMDVNAFGYLKLIVLYSSEDLESTIDECNKKVGFK